MATSLKAVFFDIGDTLGTVTQSPLHLTPFSDTLTVLQKLTGVLSLRIGVITTLGSLTEVKGRKLLEDAGLITFLDPAGFVSEKTPGSPGVPKPDPKIYQFAASQLGLSPEECLFVGENLAEAIGAVAAGMRAIPRFRP